MELRVGLTGRADRFEMRREPLVEEVLPVLLRLPDVDDSHRVAVPPHHMEDVAAFDLGRLMRVGIDGVDAQARRRSPRRWLSS